MRFAVVRESELAPGNGELGRPSVRLDARPGVPDGVPVAVALGVVEKEDVLLRAGGVHGEEEGRALVVVAVESDVDPIRGGIPVPARQVADDLAGLRIVRLDAYVDAAVVVNRPDGGSLRRRQSVVGFVLHKTLDGGRRRPVRLVEDAVDADSAVRDPNGLHRRRRGLRAGRRRVPRRGPAESGGREYACRGERRHAPVDRS